MAETKVTYELVPINYLELDIENPRIKKWIEMYGPNVTEEQMALALGAGTREDGESGPTFMSLKQSIRTHRGIIHPIIARREPNGRTVVIEGNTRVMIYKEFKDKKVEGDWGSIPAMVYEGMSEEMIDAIRLQAHRMEQDQAAEGT